MNDDQLNVNTVAGSGYLDGYACWSSYGWDFYTKKFLTFALRSSTAAVRLECFRMVTSALQISTIPTGGISPGISDNIRFSYAFFTNSTGEVDYESPNIIYSYGNKIYTNLD